MLGSYALGYWACQAVHDAVRILAATIPKAAFIARSAELAVDNFSFYLLVTAPAELNQFDERFDLNLTR
jgi:hypothetical protein